MTVFKKNITEHLSVVSNLVSLNEIIEESSNLISKALLSGGKLLLCGNGGSASDAQHIAAEFVGRFLKERRPLAAISLSTDTSALTCISNDYSFDDVFSRQLLAIARPGDCLIAISTSGNSNNVIRAVEVARGIGVTTIGMLGRDGGKLKSLCDKPIVVNSNVTARIQEAHILIGHTICEIVEDSI